MNTILVPLLLTTVAGMSTGFGGFIVFFTKGTNKKLFSTMLGFSAGVMIYISFMELLQDSKATLVTEMGNVQGQIVSLGAFFAGILAIAIIDNIIPEYENPHEFKSDLTDEEKEKKALYKIGMFSALIIFVHNFPEGLATFFATIQNVKLGLFMMIAILIHNIPEGMAIAIPTYYSTKSKRKAIGLSFIAGFAEPIGGLLGYIVLAKFINPIVLAITFAVIAGIMVYIALDELLPSAEKYGEHHWAIRGLIIGMIVIAVSIIGLS